MRRVADLYNLSSDDMVTIHKIEPRDVEEVLQAVAADFLSVTIKDQFILRGDMHFFRTLSSVAGYTKTNISASETSTRGINQDPRT
jgi:hypothetical protein